MIQLPKIKKALPRAIAHELQSPGELLDYLTYLHIVAMDREYRIEQLEQRKHDRRSTR